jgi:hypothetical protein
LNSLARIREDGHLTFKCCSLDEPVSASFILHLRGWTSTDDRARYPRNFEHMFPG